MNAGLVAHTLRGEGFDASEDGTGRGTPLVPISFQTRGSNIDLHQGVAATCGLNIDRASGGAPCIAFDPTQITSRENRSNPQPGDPCHTLAKGAHAPAIAFNARQDPINGPINGPIDTDGSTNGVMVPSMQVRRLTPTECERLMGFPDGYTAITWRGKPAADGPRYKALGNSWATNCARWVGRRIAIVDTLRGAS
jgi:DNA (cytosine-5)-methyltransferase 1